MLKASFAVIILAVLVGSDALAYRHRPRQVVLPKFKKVFIVMLENADYESALKEPFLAKLAQGGALLTNYSGVTHPSQGNYFALTSGDSHSWALDFDVNLDVTHIGDVLEAHGFSWKAYAQDYPGNCFLGTSSGKYVRKHLPFVSYTNLQNNLPRCTSHIVNADGLSGDIETGDLPTYSMFVPDVDNSGHSTNVTFASKWMETFFGPLLQNPEFTKDLLFAVIFDESENWFTNHIYTVLWGDSVVSGSQSNSAYDHYSFLRTIEDTFGLGAIDDDDAEAKPITGIWK